jgi:hypothetical protein
MTTVAGVPATSVASLALWVAALVAGVHRLIGASGGSLVGRALNGTLHPLAAAAFAVAFGLGALVASSPPGFLLLASVGFVCGHEALVSRLGARLWHWEWPDSRGLNLVLFFVELVTATRMQTESDHDEADGSPFLPPRESRVRRLAFGAVALLALVGATALLG